MIGELDGVLADRCLPIPMKRKMAADKVMAYRSRVVAPIAKTWTFAKPVCSGAYSLTNRRKFAFFAPKLGVQTPITLKFAKVQ